MTYNWRVTHPSLGEVEIKADDKLHAIIGAAKFWKQSWTRIAYACSVENKGEYIMEPAPRKGSRRGKEKETDETV